MRAIMATLGKGLVAPLFPALVPWVFLYRPLVSEFVIMEISPMMMMIIDNIAIRLTLCQALFQITLPLTPPCPRNIYFYKWKQLVLHLDLVTIKEIQYEEFLFL